MGAIWRRPPNLNKKYPALFQRSHQFFCERGDLVVEYRIELITIWAV
jgi:hypothetical protein